MPFVFPGEVRHNQGEGGVDHEIDACAGPEVPSTNELVVSFRVTCKGQCSRRGGGTQCVVIVILSEPAAYEDAFDDNEDDVGDKDEGFEGRRVEVVFLDTVPAGVARVPPDHCGDMDCYWCSLSWLAKYAWKYVATTASVLM